MNEKFKILLSRISSFIDLESLIKTSKQNLIFPFYHAVSNDDLPHIKHLYPIVSSRQFENDIDFFLKNYKAISTIDVIKENCNIKEKSFVLTFDDGLREFYKTAAPILLRKGIPATCFVNTAFVDNKDMLYRMKASLLIENINKKPFSKSQFCAVQQIFSEYNKPKDLLKISYNNRYLLDKIAEIVDVDFQEFLKKQQPYLTSEQIKELINKGFYIGSHSVSHPHYDELDEDTQIQETLNSIYFLKEKFNIKENLFAFPFSDFDVKKSFFDKISQEIDLSFGTASLKTDTVKTNFQRIAMEVSGYKNAETYIKSEYILFLIKKLLKKHIIYRK
ncbi:MAG: polysaccharide deacetylase family protein [Prevotellaceae bacterium]|jgi:peptidoglycan/xylan/chitin deacetylase (PgdA/CDA1 family)|nr:polysaccharide deacetylase family protein [Prevotellaceae bacterium]